MHCSMLCLFSVQLLQPDPRVTRLVEELSTSLKREAELPQGDQIPAVLVLNKVCCDSSLSYELEAWQEWQEPPHTWNSSGFCKPAAMIRSP